MAATEDFLQLGVQALRIADSEPMLPPELERQIFEIAGLAYPGMIPTFLCVARRIQVWIEPLLYRVVWVDIPTHAAKTEAIRTAMKSKPSSFFHAVHHLFIDSSSELSRQEARDLLRLCAKVTNFAVIGDFSESGLLPILAEMQIERLSTCLHDLFGSPSDVDLAHPLFLSITHLDIFANLAEPYMYAQLATLPSLTHVCLNGDVGWDIFRTLLSDCKMLVLLVDLWQPHSDPRAEAFAAEAPFQDDRFVVGVYNKYWVDWEAGAEGREDFWAKAEAFVARKRSGEVKESLYWAGLLTQE
ncbi:hypothetical protein DFH06DRAFT_661564 [Mycena polygramma]|nr:hypothetical protein DFH06DRAFT_661564 [Mycena polygramma]